jgi:hypothetical protein
MTRIIFVYHFTWNGLVIRITYEPAWLPAGYWSEDQSVAHLQVQVREPSRAELPISETGYKSHFTSPAVVNACGGPVAYVREWLDLAARAPEWQAAREQSRQYVLL